MSLEKLWWKINQMLCAFQSRYGADGLARPIVCDILRLPHKNNHLFRCKIWLTVGRYLCAVSTSAAGSAASSSDSSAVPSSNTASTLDNNMTAPHDSCAAETGLQTAGDDTVLFPPATSVISTGAETTQTSSCRVGGPGRRKRGRPVSQSQLAVQRRHQKMLDVCTL